MRRTTRSITRAVVAACLGVAWFAVAAQAQTLTDTDLVAQPWVRGLTTPTGAEVVNSRGDLFVIEKDTGQVKFVRDRRVRRTLLDLPVANQSEQGLLGMALSPTFAQDNLVYLYYAASTADGGSPSANAIVRYRYDGEKLVFNRKLKTMPATPGPNHDGGRLTFGPDGKLYAVIGDLNRNEQTSNYANGAISRTGAILRLEPWGASPADNPFYSSRNVGTSREPLNDIYAYGVRNSFGMAFDPVSQRMWDSENGPTSFDELNIVAPGFNSGWERMMGPANRLGGVSKDLVSLGTKAAYSDPEFSWKSPIAPTDLLFFPNGRLGNQYRGDLFVGTVRGGKILHFDLNRTRTGLLLSDGLADLVADNAANNLFLESESTLFGNDFGVVSDLLAAPGGMYVVSLTNGAIYRVTTAPSGLTASSLGDSTFAMTGIVPEPGASMAILALAATCLKRVRRAI